MRVADVRHALISGAAGSIGGALVRAIAHAAPRARISLVDRDRDGVEAHAENIGHAARGFVCDLADVGAVEDAYTEITADEPVDLLVNCAGLMELRSFAATPWALGDRLLAINLRSPLRLMSLAVPTMRARRRGIVVNIASMAGLVPLRGGSYYGATKAGLAMASEIARIELARHDVTVVTVYPGPVASPLERRARAQVPSSWLTRFLPIGDAETLGARIVRAADRQSARVVYPRVYEAAAEMSACSRRITERMSPDPID